MAGDGCSHYDYVMWLEDNGARSPGHTLATHAESHMRLFENRYSIVKNFKSLSHVYDFCRSRYGPVLAAEAFRRALVALSEPISVAIPGGDPENDLRTRIG